MNRSLAVFLAVFSWALCGAWMHGSTAPQTSDTHASQATQNVLTYLQNIGFRASHRVVTGQQCCGAFTPATDYSAEMAAIHSATGVYPGLIGADYGEWDPANGGSTPPNYPALNAVLETAWTAGSLVEISYHANNPWYGDYWSDTRCNGGTLADLVNPVTPVYAAWHTQIGLVAAGLQQLQAAGVVVLWRPFLEQNSSNWWWVSCNAGMTQLQAVWWDMFNTFTTTYGLHNLIWVYASNHTNASGVGAYCPNVVQESGLCLYPGAAYVDVVGQDEYRDLTGPMPDNYGDNYPLMAALSKVLAYTERGPAETNGTSPVFETLIPGIVANGKSPRPLVSYFMAWNGAYDIASNLGATTLMSDPNAANQNDVAAVMACMATATTYAARVACALH